MALGNRSEQPVSAAPAKCFHDSLVSLQQRVHGRRNVARPRVFERTRRSSSLGRPSSASLRMRPAPRRARPKARPPRAGAARATRPRQLTLPRRTPRASAAPRPGLATRGGSAASPRLARSRTPSSAVRAPPLLLVFFALLHTPCKLVSGKKRLFGELSFRNQVRLVYPDATC